MINPHDHRHGVCIVPMIGRRRLFWCSWNNAVGMRHREKNKPNSSSRESWDYLMRTIINITWEMLKTILIQLRHTNHRITECIINAPVESHARTHVRTCTACGMFQYTSCMMHIMICRWPAKDKRPSLFVFVPSCMMTPVNTSAQRGAQRHWKPQNFPTACTDFQAQ